MKKFTPTFFLLILVFCFSVAAANAQTAILEGKRKLIAELVAVTKTDKQMTDVTNTMLDSFAESYPLMVKQTVEKMSDLKPAEKEVVEKTMVEGHQSFIKKFRERLPQVINYQQYIQDEIYPIYDKLYTETELRDMIAFYKTATGQKVIETMPQLFAQSSAASQKLVPKVLELVDEILQQEFKTAKQPPPGAKTKN